MIDDLETQVCSAYVELANCEINGSPSQRAGALARLRVLREQARAAAAERISARAAAEQAAALVQAADPYNTDGARRVPPRRVTRLFTPHGTLTHAITGRAVRPATARERASFELARMRGERSLLIQHMNDGVICEEPYIVTDTKTLEMVDFER